MKVSVVIVTYNRKALLARCLYAIVNQTRVPDQIFVIDNASTDGTERLLVDDGWLDRPDVHFIRLGENTGGAGGFHRGLKVAVEAGADWVWMMDDDAEPFPDALAELVSRDLLPGNIYGSVAISGDKLSWPMIPVGGKRPDAIYDVGQLKPEASVTFIPFLGILVHASLVRRIGLPDETFFLAADDVEYCLRARKANALIVLVGSSFISHPLSTRYSIGLFGLKLYSLQLPPWKRYYDVRNRLFVAHAHYGLAFYYKTIPGSVLRFLATLWHEGERVGQTKAFFGGMVDGLLNRRGRRHGFWNL